MRHIAAFDFDGTLTHGDTVLPFLVQACGRRRVARAIARVAPIAGRTRIGRPAPGGVTTHHRDVTKELLLRQLFAGDDPARVEAQGRAFAGTIPGRLRAQMLDQVAWHRGEGHELVIVSASLLAYLQPFAEEHGFDHVIAVGLEVGDDGRLTGGLTGPNVRGPEKAVRLGHWLDGAEVAELWAYGNSSGDAELLEMATRPVWVTPQDRPNRPGRGSSASGVATGGRPPTVKRRR